MLKFLDSLQDRFEATGLNERDVCQCIHDLGALSLKADELLLVIDASKSNFKVFLWHGRCI